MKNQWGAVFKCFKNAPPPLPARPRKSSNITRKRRKGSRASPHTPLLPPPRKRLRSTTRFVILGPFLFPFTTARDKAGGGVTRVQRTFTRQVQRTLLITAHCHGAVAAANCAIRVACFSLLLHNITYCRRTTSRFARSALGRCQLSFGGPGVGFPCLLSPRADIAAPQRCDFRWLLEWYHPLPKNKKFGGVAKR